MRRNLISNPKAAVNLAGYDFVGMNRMIQGTFAGASVPAHVEFGAQVQLAADGDYAGFTFTPDPEKTFWAAAHVLHLYNDADDLLVQAVRVSDGASAGGYGAVPVLEDAARYGFLVEPLDGSPHRLEIRLSGNGMTIAILTALMLEEAESDPELPYRDGDYPGWEWDGAAGVSMSRESAPIPPAPEHETPQLQILSAAEIRMRFDT